jgi:hypothetical protein
MELRITKKQGKPHTIAYERNNGSITWMPANDFFVLHDLSHFAIEKELGYTTAFMGMLNNGMDIKDFEDREKRKSITISREASYAENMANLFLTEKMQGNFSDFNAVLASAFVNMAADTELPLLKETEIENVRNAFANLVQKWNKLAVGETLALNIDL